MARNDNRTEKPTAKRKHKARQQGQVARTPEAAGWLSILFVSMLLPVVVHGATTRLTGVFGQATAVIADPTSQGALHVLEVGLGQAFDIVLPLVGMMAGLALVANVSQVGFLFSRKALSLQWQRVNPIAGIRRLLSPNTLWQLVKEVVKLGLVGLLAFQAVDALVHRVVGPQPADIGPLAGYTATVLLHLVREVAFGGLVVAVGDYAFQRRRIGQLLKMTKQEVKDEHRQAEGDPAVKNRIRTKQRQMSRMRMMAAVARADVVVTNPTHYAVALRYEPGNNQAPRVVAKGADDVALRIREEARAHDVPVVEDPPLARAIFAACDLDAVVPPELYLAVARVLAFVFTLPSTVRASGIVHRRPTTALTA